MLKLILAITSFLLATVASAQIVTTVAGVGTAGYSGDGFSATMASLNGPNGLAIDSAGNLYISDYWNHVIRKVNSGGVICTIAGNGTPGYSGDGGAATTSQLNYPVKIAIDRSGNLFIADKQNNRIRKISSAGMISTVAGTGIASYNGDGIAATTANLSSPCGVDVDTMGNVYIADFGNNRIRKVSPTGVITTVAGNGIPGNIGDGGPATAAELDQCFGVWHDNHGNIFIADNSNNKIRKVSSTDIITTFAGNGSAGFSGDGGQATAAQFNDPAGIAFDSSGNVYIADQLNNRIRKVSPSGLVNTVVGTGVGGYNGDGLNATSTQINSCNDIVFDASYQLIFTDNLNYRVRKLLNCIPFITHQPVHDTVAALATAKYWIVSPGSPVSYQWQEDPGTGFVDLANVLPYSGVFTDTLTIYSVTTLFNNSHYRCIVSNGSCEDTSSSVVLIVNSHVGFSTSVFTQFDIYPNPVEDELIINLPVANDCFLQLLSETGRVMLAQKINTTAKLDLSKLPAGVYILKAFCADNVINKKVIKL